MQIEFAKYQGTGNDFVMINNLDGRYDSLTIDQVRFICDRRFGVGSDGLIRINSAAGCDFEMDFFNPDGSKSFCGNGARCSVAFAESLRIASQKFYFKAIDGVHDAVKTHDLISLHMGDVNEVNYFGTDIFIHTGSPHYMHFVKENELEEVVPFGKKIRYSERFAEHGVNVNLVHCASIEKIDVRTYERGVEDETLSCGTGVTASALASSVIQNKYGELTYDVSVRGGQLSVTFDRKSEQQFENVWLTGPAVFVFNGKIDV